MPNWDLRGDARRRMETKLDRRRMGSDRGSLEPRRRPRQQRSERTRTRILEAAEIVFSRYGFAASTTNRIAEWADVSVGSLYQFYSSKDAILLELASRHLDAAVTDGFHPDPVDATPRLYDVVRAMVRSSIDNHRADPSFLRVLAEDTPRCVQLMDKVNEVQARRMAQLRDAMAACDEVRVNNPGVAALLAVSTLERVVHRVLAGPEMVDPATLESEMVQLLYRYLTD